MESDTQKEQGGLFVSVNGGKSWDRISKDHRLVQRAWYYIEVFADPQNEEIVYVLNSPGLKSIDGGKSWEYLRTGHGDYHQLWINPLNNKNIIISDDGGATITVNNGLTWSTQNNQPTAQFYRVNTDNLFPYRVYGGQQDNTSVMIESRNPSGWAITDHNWNASAGGESAFIAFNPDDPRYAMGGSYQGTIELLDQKTNEGKGVMISPIQYQALQPKHMKYRFNWNAPIIWSRHDNAFYHGGNKLFKTTNLGKSWEVISPDLTRNDESKLGISGVPYTNEGAGGENYGTLSYVKDSPNEKGVIWTGSDDGLVHVTRDGGKTWTNVTPAGLQECLINSIEVSPHDNATAYIATTRYKFNDFTPGIYKTTDYGKSWVKINDGIPYGAFTRVVREDDVRKDLLYAGTETGFYVSYNGGKNWSACQLNLPVVAITDLMIRQGDLVASTQGRAFWIFDDLSIFRQYDASAKGFQLFRPEDAIRVSGFSPMDAPANDNEEKGPSAPMGTNGPTGVVMYYMLPEKVDSAASLTLQIKDGQGAVVHVYTSEPDKKFVSFPGGPGPDPTLSKKGGLNRFVWNMRYPSVEGAPNVYIEGSYRGHKASPGVYTAIMKYGAEEKTTTFSILPNPGIQATAADYQESHEFLSKVEAGITEIHRAVNQLKEAKRQTEDLIKVLEGDAPRKEIKDAAEALVKKISAWDEKVVQRKSESNDDIINFVNKISADYIFLKGESDSNTPMVSQGAREQLDALNSLWRSYKAEFDEMVQKDIVNLNTLCKQKGVDKVSLPTGK